MPIDGRPTPDRDTGRLRASGCAPDPGRGPAHMTDGRWNGCLCGTASTTRGLAGPWSARHAGVRRRD